MVERMRVLKESSEAIDADRAATKANEAEAQKRNLQYNQERIMIRLEESCKVQKEMKDSLIEMKAAIERLEKSQEEMRTEIQRINNKRESIVASRNRRVQQLDDLREVQNKIKVEIEGLEKSQEEMNTNLSEFINMREGAQKK